MCLRLWQFIFLGVFLITTLAGCGLSVPLAPAGTQPSATARDNDRYQHGRYRRGHNPARADNAATADYFSLQSGKISTSNDSDPNSSNLWSAMRADFQLNHYASTPAVQAQIAWFMHNQGYLDRTARRAAPFMYYIYQQVKARHLPAELVLLPIIESAYNPFVSSPAGASGLWQLVPGTAHNFGVRENWWYDGRRDITASTRAALDYLTYLNNFFGGNWILAIAAYDTGQGNVEAAIRRNARRGLSTDYWNLPLAVETESYVPRLLALAAIIQNPGAYSISLPPISNAPYLSEVEISSQVTLEQAARLADISLSELKILNPGYRRNTLAPNQPYRLLLPMDRVPVFRAHLLQQSASGSAQSTGGLWGKYKVQPGDTWRQIAKRFNTPIGLLQEVNQLQHASVPPVGQVLFIPENENNESALATATAQSQMQQPTSAASASVPDQNAEQAALAAAGNTAVDNNTDTDDNHTGDNDNGDNTPIAAPNLSDATTLDSGAMRAVTREENREQPPEENKNTLRKMSHTVRQGDSLDSIARKYHVTPEELRRWNKLSTHHRLRDGEKLVILQKERQTEKDTRESHKKYHDIARTQTKSYAAIRSGDTLESIARRHKTTVAELEKKNKISRHTKLHAGERLEI